MKKQLLVSGFGFLCLVTPLHAQELTSPCDSCSPPDRIAFAAIAEDRPQGKTTGSQEMQVDEFPKPIKRADPVYPQLARKAGIEGVVYVQVSIDTTGAVTDTKILKSENDVLNEAALQAARQWTFTPAMKDWKKLAIVLTIPFRFKLADKGKDKAEMDKLGYPLLKVVEAFLNGKGDAGSRTQIMPEAYLIDGTSEVNLIEAVEGKSKSDVFTSEQSRSVSTIRLFMNDDKSAATVAAMTMAKDKSSTRWHTVVWVKTEGGKWKIQHWHTSR